MKGLIQTACIYCRRSKTSSKEQRLRAILSIVKEQKKDLDKNEKMDRSPFAWNIHPTCKYGMFCSDLDQERLRCSNMSAQVDPCLHRIATNGTEEQARRILELLRGEFPMVYKQFEREYKTAQLHSGSSGTMG